MDEKKAVRELLAEILSIMDGEPARQSKHSWPPRTVARNGSALAFLSLILGILLGVLIAMLLHGCSMQNACIIGAGAAPLDAIEMLDTLDDLDAGAFDASFLEDL